MVLDQPVNTLSAKGWYWNWLPFVPTFQKLHNRMQFSMMECLKSSISLDLAWEINRLVVSMLSNSGISTQFFWSSILSCSKISRLGAIISTQLSWKTLASRWFNISFHDFGVIPHVLSRAKNIFCWLPQTNRVKASTLGACLINPQNLSITHHFPKGFRSDSFLVYEVLLKAKHNSIGNIIPLDVLEGDKITMPTHNFMC